MYGHFSYLEVRDETSPNLSASIPNGPSTSTVLGSSVFTKPFFRGGGGSRIRRLTSAGSDNGALPMRDLHFRELEKSLVEVASGKEGIKHSRFAIELLCNTMAKRWHLNTVECMFWEEELFESKYSLQCRGQCQENGIHLLEFKVSFSKH